MTKVAIIGAGCAGLGAARTLLEKGGKDIEVILIDAFARMGGRARTDSSAGFPFDLGPQYIQDPNINPWMKIAEQLDFETEKGTMDGWYRIRDGLVWKDAEFPPAAALTISEKIGESYAVAETLDNAPPTFEPVSKDADTALGSACSGFGPHVESAEPWQYIASDLARQVEDPQGGVQFVTKGLGTLVEAFGDWLQKRYKNLRVAMGSVVTRIELQSGTNQIGIYVGAEKICDADYCIVSVPCSVTPRIAFVPPLEQARVSANSYVVLGSYKKVAFKPTSIPNLIEVDKQYYMYDYVTKGCWQYFRLPTAPDTLIGVAAGNFACRLDNLFSNLAAADIFIAALNAAYPSLNPMLPSIVVPPERPRLVTNWSRQAHIWGAYSYTRYDGGDPALTAPLEARERIGQPHAGGRIRFAGEATWTPAYGTIHGAYFSGQREANAILDGLGL